MIDSFLCCPSWDFEGQSPIPGPPSAHLRPLIPPAIEGWRFRSNISRFYVPAWHSSLSRFPLEAAGLNWKHGQQPYAVSEMTRVQLASNNRMLRGQGSWYEHVGQAMAFGCMSSEIGEDGREWILRRTFAVPSLTLRDSKSNKVRILLRWQQGIKSSL